MLPSVQTRPASDAPRDVSTTRWPRCWLISTLFHLGVLGLLGWLVWSIPLPPRIELEAAPPSSQAAANIRLAAEANVPEVPLTDGQAASQLDRPVDLRSQMQAADAAEITAPEQIEPGSIEFFGTRAYGDRFVFVLDISFSMKARLGARFRRASEELIRSVSNLRPGQQYYVFLFCYRTRFMFDESDLGYVSVHEGHVAKLRKWLDDLHLGAGTDPRRALALTLRLKPDAVFLLSDGQFNEPRHALSETGWLDRDGHGVQGDVQSGVERWYRERPIHTIAFENPFFPDQMQTIADASGGRHRYVPVDSLEPVDEHQFHEVLQKIGQLQQATDSEPLQYKTRIHYAREFINDSEFAYAEYLLRPLADPPETIPNHKLIHHLRSIACRELGDVRLEDFPQQRTLQVQ